jgi:hypothetical protein
MAINFTYKYSKCVLEKVPNDVSITLTSYLVDSHNQMYIDPNTLAIDTFDVIAYKSSLPTSNFENYLKVLAATAIRTKYNKTIGGYASKNNNIITQIETTAGLIPGLYIYGDYIPENTTLLRIRDGFSVELTKGATETGTTTLRLNTNGWIIDYSAIAELVTIINFDEI